MVRPVIDYNGIFSGNGTGTGTATGFVEEGEEKSVESSNNSSRGGEVKKDDDASMVNILTSSIDRLSELTQELDNILETTALVNDSCNVALETLNDMLTFDKIDENKLVIEMAEINPWTLLCDAINPFQINARESQVLLTSECIDNDLKIPNNLVIKVDKFKISQVLRNLFSNALKFTLANGQVKVIVEKRNSADRNNYSGNSTAFRELQVFVRISVVDSGCGISAANQKKLFGQYVQFNASALQQGKGSGLGLWISKSNLFGLIFKTSIYYRNYEK
jgi:signal transduction histidine kinase